MRFTFFLYCCETPYFLRVSERRFFQALPNFDKLCANKIVVHRTRAAAANPHRASAQ